MAQRPTSEQRRWLDAVLGEHRILEDMSWGTTPSTVWKVEDHLGRVHVVKAAGGPMRHHVAREIDAHESVVPALAETGDGQVFVAASRELGILVVSHLAGELVEGTPAASDPGVHRRAGALLARIHDRDGRLDDRYEHEQTRRIRGWLESPHRIPADRVRAVRDAIAAHQPRPVRLVPTHGDWHPRNWVIERSTGRVGVIDFGRFAWRPAQTDLVRCWSKDWRDHPGLEMAHLEGYGGDPRDDTWPMDCLRESVSTAAWAHQMGDERFEHHGLDMIDRALQLLERV